MRLYFIIFSFIFYFSLTYAQTQNPHSVFIDEIKKAITEGIIADHAPENLKKKVKEFVKVRKQQIRQIKYDCLTTTDKKSLCHDAFIEGVREDINIMQDWVCLIATIEANRPKPETMNKQRGWLNAWRMGAGYILSMAASGAILIIDSNQSDPEIYEDQISREFIDPRLIFIPIIGTIGTSIVAYSLYDGYSFNNKFLQAVHDEFSIKKRLDTTMEIFNISSLMHKIYEDESTTFIKKNNSFETFSY